ncbi:hypothetical protein PsYK624_067860 [Phanerochaete sordida]|uniref:EF-hand domain-containing protein n=1 Tax=Phanerochaete sordida TaxID=48140 RepID=A0A9P3LE61_9APHY|nr:hypothetical protein PsYK624_067860 [Phanerochaete sordida]
MSRSIQPRVGQMVDMPALQAAGVKIAEDQQTKRARLLDQAKSLQGKLDKARNVISKASDIADPLKDTKFASDILAPVREIIGMVDAFADIHPAFKFVVGVAKVVIDMELKRRENDKQVALVYYTMTSTLSLLGEIDDIFRDGERLQQTLVGKLGEVCEVIKNFGNFCEVYYQQKVIPKLWNASKSKSKLTEFTSDFSSKRDELQVLISTQAGLTIIDVKVDVRGVRLEMAQIKELLLARSAKEQEFEAKIENLGGKDAVAKSDELLKTLAADMKETFEVSLKRSLKVDFDDALKRNRELFSTKIDMSTEKIQDSVKMSTATIIQTLERGPHEFIEDEDIKVIWRDMPSRTSAKTRQFLAALHGFFQRKFVQHEHESGEQHPDAWTLYFLSKVIFYPAIGDGMDEDSSGFLSVHELNDFLKSKPDAMKCSAIAWITFWAVGPHTTDIEHLNAIEGLIEELESAPDDVRQENVKRVKYFASIAKPLKCIKVHKKMMAYLNDDEDDIDEYEALQRLRKTWRTTEMARIKANVAKLGYELPRPDYLTVVLGGRRLEHCIMPLVRVLLERHMQIVRLAKKEIIAVCEFEDMRDTWNCIFIALDRRLDVLEHVWRQQRIDPEAQVESYCGGLFEAWYDLKQSRLEMDLPSDYDDDDDGLYDFSDDDEDGDDDDEDGSQNEDADEDAKDEDDDEASVVDGRAKDDGASVAPPESLLHYSLGGDSEDDDAGLTTDDDSDWEPPASRKIKAEKEIKHRLKTVEEKLENLEEKLEGVDEKLDTLTEMLSKLLSAQNIELPAKRPSSTDSAAVAATRTAGARESADDDRDGEDNEDGEGSAAGSAQREPFDPPELGGMFGQYGNDDGDEDEEDENIARGRGHSGRGRGSDEEEDSGSEEEDSASEKKKQKKKKGRQDDSEDDDEDEEEDSDNEDEDEEYQHVRPSWKLRGR